MHIEMTMNKIGMLSVGSVNRSILTYAQDFPNSAISVLNLVNSLMTNLQFDGLVSSRDTYHLPACRYLDMTIDATDWKWVNGKLETRFSGEPYTIFFRSGMVANHATMLDELNDIVIDLI